MASRALHGIKSWPICIRFLVRCTWIILFGVGVWLAFRARSRAHLECVIIIKNWGACGQGRGKVLECAFHCYTTIVSPCNTRTAGGKMSLCLLL